MNTPQPDQTTCQRSAALNSLEIIEAELFNLRKMVRETGEPELIIALAEWRKALRGLLEMTKF